VKEGGHGRPPFPAFEGAKAHLLADTWATHLPIPSCETRGVHKLDLTPRLGTRGAVRRGGRAAGSRARKPAGSRARKGSLRADDRFRQPPRTGTPTLPRLQVPDLRHPATALGKGAVAGLVQLQSDGEIQAHLSALITDAQWRRRGLGRALVREALARAGGLRIDVLSRSGSYYLSLGAKSVPGFRLHKETMA
jgi:GNAT superfamily N-acetyltransferase